METGIREEGLFFNVFWVKFLCAITLFCSHHKAHWLYAGSLPSSERSPTMKKNYFLFLCAVLVFTCAQASAMTIDGDASDWAGKLVNLDATNRTAYLDVVNFGCVVEGGYVHFAQTIEFDAVNGFSETSEGIWANWWIDIDGDNTSGHAGWQVEAVGWAEFVYNEETYGVNEGIDIGVEVGHWQTDSIDLYYTNGSDCPSSQYPDGYPDSSGTFAFSEDGTFLECCVPISELIAAAVANQSVDTTVYGTIDQTAAADPTNWRVGARIDGKDTSVGITYPCSATQKPWIGREITGHEGLIDLPIIPGDADLDGDVDLADLGTLADNWGATAAGNPVNVPEPATMSLLAVGALAILKRRK